MTSQKRSSPVAPQERIIALDFLRGVALLGILVMNIQGFAAPFAAYINPTVYGDLTGLNYWVWAGSHLLTDNKFMTLFSMLYGAGIILITQKMEAQGRHSAWLHYKRTFWLLIIGLAHAYLLWSGDILVCYALVALIVFFFRKLSPLWLIGLGVVVFSVSTLLQVSVALSMPNFPPEVIADLRTDWQPDADEIAREIAVYQSGWFAQMTDRVPATLEMQTTAFFFVTGWRAAGLMLIGMALFKLGVLTGQRSAQFYRGLLLVGWAIGFPLILTGMSRNSAAGWSLEYSYFIGSQFNYWGSVGVSLGYIALMMLILQSGRGTWAIEPFTAVGRMALSNYLFQTIVATFIFYGHGLGLFGQVERVGQMAIVCGIWTVQLIISSIWLRYFRFGPAEWLWRSLTYVQPQPFMAKRV